jgi:hypothetical protein
MKKDKCGLASSNVTFIPSFMLKMPVFKFMKNRLIE